MGKTPIALGGDHLIKASGIAASFEKFNDLNVLYLDAHPDCKIDEKLRYDTILHHMFLLGLRPENTFILGLRQVNRREALGIKHWSPQVISDLDLATNSLQYISQKIIGQRIKKAPLYISIDMDGLDIASAPAVEAPFPGGPSLLQVISLIHILGKHFHLVGMDLTEFVPEFDQNGITALSAARLVKEFYSISSMQAQHFQVSSIKRG